MALFESQKIIKNAWKSDLIEKLSKITTNINKLNFHDATETLEGSIKLYTTRVDNVSLETTKLIETVNFEVQKKEKKKKKKILYIEKEGNLLEAPFFEYKRKLDILSKYLISNNLLIETYKGYDEKGINLFTNNSLLLESETKFNYEDYNFTNFITPSIQKENFEFLTKSRDKIESIDLELENEIAIEREQDFFNESSEKELEIEVNPFVYLGWGGPQFWKMKQRKILQKKNKIEKQKIDLKQNFNYKQCFENGSVFFTREVLNERKKTNYYLPEDELFTGKDLFSFNFISGFYTSNKIIKKNFDKKDKSFNFHEENVFNLEEEILPNEIDDFEGEINNEMDEEQKNLTKILISKYTKIPKKVDMHKLKENVFESINSNSFNLNEVVKSLDTKYNVNERKDISIHYCFISLLHLANEKGISLESDGLNIRIKL